MQSLLECVYTGALQQSKTVYRSTDHFQTEQNTQQEHMQKLFVCCLYSSPLFTLFLFHRLLSLTPQPGRVILSNHPPHVSGFVQWFRW